MRNVQDVIDRIPPEAWPLIDMLFRITIVLAVIWLALALVAWWRRRAYNLTVASTARRSGKAQPDFLHVDEKARKAAIARGEAHEEFIEDRERDEAAAALEAAKQPINLAQRIAGFAALLMSIFTLSTVALGAVTNVSKMGDALKSVSSVDKVEKIVSDHWLGTTVAALVIAWHVYKYFADRSWKEK
jgi:hypothetical protein